MNGQDILREWKAAHAAIVDSLLEDETISGARLEQLMDAHPPDPSLVDVSDWNVRHSLLSSLSQCPSECCGRGFALGKSPFKMLSQQPAFSLRNASSMSTSTAD